jgi:hypothetical protein
VWPPDGAAIWLLGIAERYPEIILKAATERQSEQLA